jgi:DNA-binding response OmpR family regulator
MAISKLRKKIEKNPRKPEIIKTVRNIGYQLTTAVNFIEA